MAASLDRRAKKKRMKPIAGWCIVCEGVGPIWPTFSETRKGAKERFGPGLEVLKLYRPAKVWIRELP